MFVDAVVQGLVDAPVPLEARGRGGEVQPGECDAGGHDLRDGVQRHPTPAGAVAADRQQAIYQ